jgi:hypothetical protein
LPWIRILLHPPPDRCLHSLGVLSLRTRTASASCVIMPGRHLTVLRVDVTIGAYGSEVNAQTFCALMRSRYCGRLRKYGIGYEWGLAPAGHAETEPPGVGRPSAKLRPPRRRVALDIERHVFTVNRATVTVQLMPGPPAHAEGPVLRGSQHSSAPGTRGDAPPSRPQLAKHVMAEHDSTGGSDRHPVSWTTMRISGRNPSAAGRCD